MTNPNNEYPDSRKLPASFRDPDGFLFVKSGEIFRHIAPSYKKNYDALMQGGLYQVLVQKEFLIPHEEVDPALSEGAYKVIRPARVPFISYPYEWCFSQIKDAALLMLRVAQTALDYEMILKDASIYNIQFMNGRAIFIDTLSFEKYEAEKPWVGYRQFCQHFLAPLALMAGCDQSLQQLLKIHIDGVPLALASKLLPRSTYLNFALLTHIHLHAQSQRHFASREAKTSEGHFSRRSLRTLFEHLTESVLGLTLKKQRSAWSHYYEESNYSREALNHKKSILREWLAQMNPALVWDLGANTGVFSRVVSEFGIQSIAFDADISAVELNYQECCKKKERHILPLVMDLTNPSPSLGWAHRERMSLAERGPADLVLALALIHHLAIANNVPLERLAAFFFDIAKELVIEFVPKEDSQVKRLLATREDIFPSYTVTGFENAFLPYFKMIAKENVKDSLRTLYRLRRAD